MLGPANNAGSIKATLNTYVQTVGQESSCWSRIYMETQDIRSDWDFDLESLIITPVVSLFVSNGGASFQKLLFEDVFFLVRETFFWFFDSFART